MAFWKGEGRKRPHSVKTDKNGEAVKGKRISEDGIKLRTTHIAPNARAKTIATLAGINGELSLVYLHEDEIESYITVEEIFKALTSQVPQFEVAF